AWALPSFTSARVLSMDWRTTPSWRMAAVRETPPWAAVAGGATTHHRAAASSAAGRRRRVTSGAVRAPVTSPRELGQVALDGIGDVGRRLLGLGTIAGRGGLGEGGEVVLEAEVEVGVVRPDRPLDLVPGGLDTLVEGLGRRGVGGGRRAHAGGQVLDLAEAGGHLGRRCLVGLRGLLRFLGLAAAAARTAGRPGRGQGEQNRRHAPDGSSVHPIPLTHRRCGPILGEPKYRSGVGPRAMVRPGPTPPSRGRPGRGRRWL